MFASDFLHEITLDNCREEIDKILERSDLKDEHKAAILGDNARRFYKIWRANHDSVEAVRDCESFFHKTFFRLEIVSETTRFVIPSEREGF
jgi:hypothetical protein